MLEIKNGGIVKIIQFITLNLILYFFSNFSYNSNIIDKVYLHACFLKELKTKLETLKPKFYKSSKIRAQTDSYLSIPELNKLVNNSFDIKQYKNIIDNAINKERELADTHYVFYHAQKRNFIVFQDIIKEIDQ